MPRNQELSDSKDSSRPMDARDAACRVLSSHAIAFSDLQPIEPDVMHLDPRDRALAHAIIREGVVRWITLRHIVSELAGRGFETIEPRMQAVLISGAAQLLLLDRLPPHAVINESVEWAKRYIRPKAGGMVNAVLRKVAKSCVLDGQENDPNTIQIPRSDGGSLFLTNISIPEDLIARDSTLYSVPRATIKRWKKDYPDHATTLLKHSIVHPPTLVFCSDWSCVGNQADLESHDSPSHRVYTGSRTHLYERLKQSPSLRVQDPASSRVVQSIPDGAYPTIVDYCAGQGTKTRQLAERFPDSRIVAMEIDRARLETLSDVFHDSSNVIVAHVEQFESVLTDGADLILTDVPCSNSGVLARRMEARYRPMTAQVNRIAQIQREILSRVIPILNDQGVLTYSTCSIEPEENQHQCDWIKSTTDLDYLIDHQILPSGIPGDPASIYSDGSYACIFRKK